MEEISPVGDLAFVRRFGENYFSTHLLTTENHKPAVILRVGPVTGL